MIFTIGQRVRLGPIRVEPNCPDDLLHAYKSCEGRVLQIKGIQPVKGVDGSHAFDIYEFYIAHLTGRGSNRTSFRESLYLEATEIQPLRKVTKHAE